MLQIIPAVASRFSDPHFDTHQFVKRRHAVSADSHISFADFKGMHVHKRAQQWTRRLATPEWALNDEKLREVIVVYMERRFFVSRPDKTKTLLERLQIAEEAGKGNLQIMQVHLDGLLDRHHTMVKRGINRGHFLQKLEGNIQNLDSQITLIKRGLPGVVAAIVHFYYRMGWDSADIGNELHVHPAFVRQTLFRLDRAWRYVNNEMPPDVRVRYSRRGSRKVRGNVVKYWRTWERRRTRANRVDITREQILRAIKMHAEGKRWIEITGDSGDQMRAAIRRYKRLSALARTGESAIGKCRNIS